MRAGPTILILLFSICYNVCCKAEQTPDSLLAMSNKLLNQYMNAVTKKSEKAAAQIERQTNKYLATLEKQEAKLKMKLSKIDSLAVKNIFLDATKQYTDLQDKVKSKSDRLVKKAGKYFPWLDSAGTSLNFITRNPTLVGMKGDAAALKGAVSKVKELEAQFKQAASVQEFIQQRKAYLNEQLKDYQLGTALKKYNQTAYYYCQQISEYRQILNDPDKAEKKALALLNRSPAFQNFVRKNSMLANLFAAPGGDDPAAVVQNLAGLQTRAAVQNIIQTQLAAGGPNAQDLFQQNMNEAQGMLNKLKDKMKQLGSNGGGDLEMPAFKPNPQKTKTFLQRLEYGASIQSAKSNFYFPTTSDIALTVGYMLNKTNLLGIGASYRMGWGTDIKHLRISAQGIGIRSFADFKLKGSFFASGGLEYNYQQPFNSLQQIYKLNSWQKSGLIGVSKIVSMKTKVFKKTKVQLLWDILSYRQVPRTEAVKFRVVHNF